MDVKGLFFTFIKGAILGIGNIIPGVSGGTLAVSLGLYESLLNSVSGLFKNFKENKNILLPIIFGFIVGVISGSRLIGFCLTEAKTQTMLFFVGLIFGGISVVMRKLRGHNNIKNNLFCLIIFILIVLLNFINLDVSSVSFSNLDFLGYLKIFLFGAVATIGMLIPGISYSFLLMLVGYYEPILETINLLFTKEYFLSSFIILVVFILGMMLGIVLISKVISMLLRKYEVKSYYAILGFILASIVLLFLQIDSFEVNFINIFTSLVTFLWGYILARGIDKEKYYFYKNGN